MTFKIIDNYSTGDYSSVDVFQCQNCFREISCSEGADYPSDCICEFDYDPEVQK